MKIINWVVLIILILLFFRESYNQQKLDKANDEISLYALANQRLTDSLKNKNDEIIHLQEAIVFESKKIISKYSDSIFNLKKRDEKKHKETIAYYQNYINVKLRDTLYIRIDSITNYIGKDTLEYLSNSIRVPTKFKMDSNYFSIKGEIEKNNIRIDAINIPDTISGRFVVKKNGLFKANTIEYQVFNKNPYINISNSKSAIYKEKKRLHNFIIPLTLGIILGIIIK